MSNANLRHWIALVHRSSRRGRHRQTLDLFRQAQQIHCIYPDRYILPTLIRACARLPDPIAGRALHAAALRFSLHHDAFTCSALIDLYCKCRRIHCARILFDETPDRDIVVWNAMVSGYAHSGASHVALVLTIKMRSLGLRPDLVTWNTVISGCAQRGDDDMAIKLLRSMQHDEIEPDAFSWTSIVTGLVLHFKYMKAFEIFSYMVKVARVQPNSVTISSLLPACANAADLRRGKQIHGFAVAVGVGDDLYVSSALIDMYTKCGLVLDAHNVFNEMADPSTVSWNTMIFGYANQGFCQKAIELFHRMENEGARPDHLTFTAALSACSNGGMVELGRSLFQAMQEEHGIEPRLEHYACMVDMLGKAGELVEACELIAEMPMEADAFVWGALLGASRNHGNVELAQLAASHLLNLEPESAGSCVLLSNVFADAGRREDAVKAKKLIRRRKLTTLSGCSWMQVA